MGERESGAGSWRPAQYVICIEEYAFMLDALFTESG
jgi:hypothetical protein